MEDDIISGSTPCQGNLLDLFAGSGGLQINLKNKSDILCYK